LLETTVHPSTGLRANGAEVEMIEELSVHAEHIEAFRVFFQQLVN
jgi:hypothetical protein